MPAVETMDLRQKAQFWAYVSDDEHGQAQVSAAVEISVRWEDRKSNSWDAKGNTVAYDATVVVDRVIQAKSILWKGTAKQYADEASPVYYVVKDYSEVPDLKGRSVRRQVRVVRHGSTLPTIV